MVEAGASTDQTIVAQSAVGRDALFGIIELAFLFALVRGVTGASTLGGTIAAGVFMGAVSIGWALLWRNVWRARTWLEISDRAIALRDHLGTDRAVISRASGNHLRFVVLGRARYHYVGLKSDDDGTLIRLPYYGKKRIRQACGAHGWRLD